MKKAATVEKDSKQQMYNFVVFIYLFRWRYQVRLGHAMESY